MITTDHRTKLQSFLAKKGDGATIFTEGELPVILKQDPQARFFPYDKIFSMYGLGLVVHEKTIAERPQAIAAAVRGVLAAERDALKNPEGASKLWQRHFRINSSIASFLCSSSRSIRSY